MNWIGILSKFRIIILIVFAGIWAAFKFNWLDEYSTLSSEDMGALKVLIILLYAIVYIIELKLTVKDREKEIHNLKTQIK